MFPVAWAVVAVENKDTWKWFLELLVDDLEMHNGTGLTLLSDGHKGLMEAVKEVLPYVEHRQCARHVFANFRKRFTGVHFKGLFWAASKASTEEEFKSKRDEIKRLNLAAYKYLMDKIPKTWSRAYFEVDRNCDSVENEICESFNKVTEKPRRKPIITMLEEIRLYMTDRCVTMKEKGERWETFIYPAIKEKVEELKREQRFWEIQACGFHEFEARCGKLAYAVNIDKKTCSCRTWQLTVIPCVHGMGALCFINQNIEEFVSVYFTERKYLNSYRYGLRPMNGFNMWPPTAYVSPLPPKNRRMAGRPTIRRKKDANEELDRPGKKKSKKNIGKKGTIVRCSICKARGHNVATCPTRTKNSDAGTSKSKKRKKTVTADDSQLYDVAIDKDVENEEPLGTGAAEGIQEQLIVDEAENEEPQETGAADDIQEQQMVDKAENDEPQGIAPTKADKLKIRKPSERIVLLKLK